MQFSVLTSFIAIFSLFSCLEGTVESVEATIPVVDMADFRDPKQRALFVKQLSDAFQEWGFVAVKNSELDVEVLDRAYELSKLFFAQNKETKMEMYDKRLSGQRGYTPGETAKGAKKKDFKEFFSVTREYTKEQRERMGYPANIWPERVDLKTAMVDLISQLEKHGADLEEAMAIALGLEGDFFQKMIHEGDVLLRGIHYYRNPPDGASWAAAHVDSNLFTILPRATAKGLQVLSPKNEWIDVVVPKDAVIVNCGEMMQNISNGYFKSCMHRVQPNCSGQERYVFVLFMHPKPADRLDPLPQCVAKTGGKALYPTGTQKELLYERLIDGGIASDEMIQFIGQSGIVDRMFDLGRASPRVIETLKAHGCASEKMLVALKSS